MEIIAGKNGSFFVITRNVDTDTVRKLAGISFDEFGRYNAWATMKRIAKMSSEEYAAKNYLRHDILEKFDRFADAVDLKATQDLMFFIETENGREDFDDVTEIIKIHPHGFKNNFAYPLPRISDGKITDSFALKDQDVPKMLKRIGSVIERSTAYHDVKWNNVTYKADVISEEPKARKASIVGSNIVIRENCYRFSDEDWKYLQKIDDAFNKEKYSREHSWYRFNKPENEILESIITKMCKSNKHNYAMYKAMYAKFVELKNSRTDYMGILVHEFHHLRNRILSQNRCLKADVKALNALDVYYIMVEDERSAHLAVTIDRLNKYWHDKDWEDLLSKEPCFEVLKMRSEEDRDRLLTNLDFVTNIKLKHWTEHCLEQHNPKIASRLPTLQRYSSIAKGLDESRKEYMLMRSMLYTFYVYNPQTGKYKMMRLDKYIKINIPVSDSVINHIIKKVQLFINRKLGAKDMLKIKYGLTDNMIKQAANIYDASLRLKPE